MTEATRGEPQIVERDATPYVAIAALVTMASIGAVLPGLHPELEAWMAEHGIEGAAAPFWKYNVIDMTRELEIEVGMPVAEPCTGEGRVIAGTLAGGSYVTVLHVGHPSGLIETTAGLLAWAAERGLAFDVAATDRGERWGGRLEIYKTNPAEVPDLSAWEIELAFRLA